MEKTYLTRRGFLKALGITLVASQLPIGVLADSAYAHFDPAKQYGSYVVWDEDAKVTVSQAQIMLTDQISFVIPSRYRKHIKWIIRNPRLSPSDPLKKHGSLGWKYTPK